MDKGPSESLPDVPLKVKFSKLKMGKCIYDCHTLLNRITQSKGSRGFVLVSLKR
jgi:hypothetical protein